MHIDREPPRLVRVHGPAMRFVRTSRGLSIGHLARAAGCSVSFLAMIERGERRGVAPEVFAVIARELELDDVRAVLLDPYGSVVRQLTGTSAGPVGPTLVPLDHSTTRAA